MKKYLLLLFAATIIAGITRSSAQPPTIEFFAGAGNPVTNGPVTTPQVITFQTNTDNPTGNTIAAFTPTLTATFSYSNAQFTGSNLATGLWFGAALGNGAAPVASPLFNTMGFSGAPTNANFSASPSNIGSGIDITQNRSVELWTSATALETAGVPVNTRPYMGDLVITFSQPVNNPVVHFAGLGGNTSLGGVTSQYTAEFELQTAGVVLSKLSGGTDLAVGSTTVLNSAVSITGSGVNGSVLATGSGITALTFAVYMRHAGTSTGTDWNPSATVFQGDAFTIGISADATTVLPLRLLSFNAVKAGNHALLKWSTTSEENTKKFIIERSANGSSYTPIAEVAAAGSSSTTKQYSFTDNSPTGGTNYYRLRSIDIDGAYSLSKIELVQINSDETAGVFPNPVYDKLTIQLPVSWQNKKLQFDIINQLGQAVITKVVEQSRQAESIIVDQLPPGTYTLRLLNNTVKEFHKIIIVNK